MLYDLVFGLLWDWCGTLPCPVLARLALDMLAQIVGTLGL